MRLTIRDVFEGIGVIIFLMLFFAGLSLVLPLALYFGIINPKREHIK